MARRSKVKNCQSATYSRGNAHAGQIDLERNDISKRSDSYAQLVNAAREIQRHQNSRRRAEGHKVSARYVIHDNRVLEHLPGIESSGAHARTRVFRVHVRA